MPTMWKLLAAATMVHVSAAHAQGVLDVCKGESKHVVEGTGQMSIAFVYPQDFPGRTEKSVLFPIGARLAVAEKAKVILVADVDKAIKLVGDKRWSETGESCNQAPPIESVLGQKHPNLSTAHVSELCDDKGCQLVVDLERHGRPTSERWVRYTAPITGAKDNLKAIAAAAPNLKDVGVPPDAPTIGLAVAKLASGKVRVRSDVDGSLEADRVMEASDAFAACSIKGRREYDIRGYRAEWMLSAKGTVYQAEVSPFSSRDPKDTEAAACLKKALEATQLPCPRDAKPVKVTTAICL